MKADDLVSDDVAIQRTGMRSPRLVSAMSIQDGQDLFTQLHQRALSLGLHQEHFQKMPNLKRIKHARRLETTTRCVKWTVTVTVVILSLVLSWWLNFPVTCETLARLWIKLSGHDPKSPAFERQKCLVKASNQMQDLARPPIHCDFCTNVSDVIKIRGLSTDEFRERFAYSGQPIVVQDGAANWSAVNVFTFGFFRDLYQPDSPALKNTESHCQFFPYKTEFKHLGEAFTMDRGRALLKANTAPWYIGWSNCDASAGNVLRSHYSRPYFLPGESESSKTDWIFMGSPGYGAHMHVDYVSLPSWQAQIAGLKLWTLQAPPECYDVCRDHSVVVHPGEIIVLDTNKWYHSTRILGEDISITIGSEFD